MPFRTEAMQEVRAELAQVRQELREVRDFRQAQLRESALREADLHRHDDDRPICKGDF